MFAEVIVLTKTQKNLQTFSYSVPKNLQNKVKIGQLVLVPFKARKIKGVIIKISKTSPDFKTKPIISLLDSSPILREDLIKLSFWIAWYYHTPIGLAIKTMLPPEGKIKTEKIIEPILPSQKAIETLNELQKSPKQKQIIWYLMQGRKPQKIKDIILKFKTSASVIKSLKEKKLIKVQDKEIQETSYKPSMSIFQPLFLNSEEKKIIDIISKSLNKKRKNVFLLHTTDYNEKIKIYSKILQKILEFKKQAIVLLPEIAIASQISTEIENQFPDQVALIHSKLPSSKRYYRWQRIKEGKANIVIGSHQAIFAPLKNLGLIIVDCEHNQSYKRNRTPSYNLREAALKLSELEKTPVILQSSVPSIEAYYNLRCNLKNYKTKKENKYLPIIKKTKMPEVQIIDLTSEIKKGNRSILGKNLQKEIKNTLNRNKKIILFLNRRGKSTFVICQECGYVLKCKNCDVPLTFHIQSYFNFLICHHCGYKTKPPNVCPLCQGHKIKYFGIGTQKVVQEVKKIFPKARVTQTDSDTIKTKKDYAQVYDKLIKNQIDILVGTQILISGFKLPKVELVGIISVDTLLNLPDFRSEEKTFQQIIELSTIVKRKIILQTYSPYNFAIQKASRYDFKGFYTQEIKKRKKLCYPPFVQLIKLVYSHKDLKNCKQEAQRLYNVLNIKVQSSKFKVQSSILGPAPCFIPKIKGEYRQQIILKGKNLHFLLDFVPSTWSVDVDPISLL
jgi:primosomal protein N' (replication factor Y)